MKKELRKAYETYINGEPDFTPGDMVEWKPGMRNIHHKGPFIFRFRSCDGSFVFCTLLEDGTFDFLEVDPHRLQLIEKGE